MIVLTKDSYKEYEDKMNKTLESLASHLNTVRAGRANPHVLDRITIDYYGTETPLQQVANIQVPEARMITITPWDTSNLKQIEKAILMSDLGINPANDGKMIRLVFPALTQERRKELAKLIAGYGEDAKVALRNVRREALDKFKNLLKKKELTEDQMTEVETQIQKLTDKFVKTVDTTVAQKEKELMEI